MIGPAITSKHDTPHRTETESLRMEVITHLSHPAGISQGRQRTSRLAYASLPRARPRAGNHPPRLGEMCRLVCCNRQIRYRAQRPTGLLRCDGKSMRNIRKENGKLSSPRDRHIPRGSGSRIGRSGAERALRAFAHPDLQRACGKILRMTQDQASRKL